MQSSSQPVRYVTNTPLLPGSNFAEVYKSAKQVFRLLTRKTKRKPYIRSAYFKKQKVFFDYFWIHLFDKNPFIRKQRLQYFAAALEVIQKSTYKPELTENPNRKRDALYRFSGRMKKAGNNFVVQIKEDKKLKRYYFMSVFPQ